MGRVYEHAAHTIVFLRLASQETDLLFNISKSLRPPGQLGHSRAFLEQFRGLSIREYKNIVKDIFTRTWFSRVWVLQELVLSSNPWVQCGISRTKWKRLCEHLLDPFPAGVATGELGRLLRPLTDMDEARNRFNVNRATTGVHSYDRFFDLIISRRGMGASDPRDMIYAHLGMADVHTQNTFGIDYEQSCSQVLEDVATQFIRSSKDLSILNHIGNIELVKRQPKPPTWVPD
ncbi:uncharacterized protein BDZ99DRAFT_549771 [Mytilinidion resinicola]|uniref:Heterokaryon incompatibility domain-containing protein n=1 Tax=Mytilinidion resinicola TaxID=574789 RepID=A0A6A6Z1Y7_9PEZI|nr:uncharacterized protein BDZ99DRAFT_549771 [Mytilinidion resinicola]KAF2815182.1 hypothetical protein BDZ99DRAFT_549771 [Mytilinidion resinicola]